MIKAHSGQRYYAPTPQDLFLELTRPIYDRLARDLQSFYSQY